jgi:hypothetical protein
MISSKIQTLMSTVRMCEVLVGSRLAHQLGGQVGKPEKKGIYFVGEGSCASSKPGRTSSRMHSNDKPYKS